jgi:acyl dehydratase
MSLDLGKIGARSQSYVHEWSWRRQALYALGIGCKRDELAYLYEGHKGGMRVYPTYAVVPSYEPLIELLLAAQTNLAMVVHGAQKVVAHRPVPAEGKVETVGVLRGIYDMKKFAQLVIETESKLGGEPLFDTEWSIIVRGEGGFGGERPPSDDGAPAAPRDRAADWTVSYPTLPEQALLYRLSGDVNPLHADPEFARSVGFEQGPILHGLCTYGHVARAVVARSAGGDAVRLRELAGQFRKPVWPGETIVVSGWELGGGAVAVQAQVEGRPEAVFANGWARISG